MTRSRGCKSYLVYDREGAGSRLQEQAQGGGEVGGGPEGVYLPHLPPVLPLISLHTTPLVGQTYALDKLQPKGHQLSLELKQQYAQQSTGLAEIWSEQACLEGADLLRTRN
jgi:hypothetical protein